jgi:hypothetical protein
LDDDVADMYITPWGGEDQDFVAAARQDVPRLVAEVIRLRRQLAGSHRSAPVETTPPSKEGDIGSLLRRDLEFLDLIAQKEEQCDAELSIDKHTHFCTRPRGHVDQHHSFAGGGNVSLDHQDAATGTMADVVVNREGVKRAR